MIDLFPDLKLIWVSSLCGIIGNEYADNAEQNARSQPVLYTVNLNRKDIIHLINRPKSTRITPIVIRLQHTERSTKRKIQFMAN